MALVLFAYAAVYATLAGALMFLAPPSSKKKRCTRRDRVSDANIAENPATPLVTYLRSPESCWIRNDPIVLLATPSPGNSVLLMLHLLGMLSRMRVLLMISLTTSS